MTPEDPTISEVRKYAETDLAAVEQQLRTWCAQLGHRFTYGLVRGPSQHNQSESLGTDCWRLYFYTETNKYAVVATPDYLGCVASSRKPRAGEWWTRGNDLPDGPFCEETWLAILRAVVAYETVRIHPVREPVPEVVARDDPLVIDD